MKSNIPSALSEYVCGGYYVAKCIEKDKVCLSSTCPQKLFSASPCVSKFVPDLWLINWTNILESERLECAEAFQLDLEKQRALGTWVTSNFGKLVFWPNVIQSLTTAEWIFNTFLEQNSNIVVFGLGLHQSNVPHFLEYATPPPQRPGFAPIGETGLYHVMNSGALLEPSGTIMGFDVLSYDTSSIGCSWLCDYAKNIESSLGIQINEFGFIEDHIMAQSMVDYVTSKPHEPGLWLPWIVVRYR